MFMCACGWAGQGMNVMQRSEDNFDGQMVSFYLYMGSRYHTQAFTASVFTHRAILSES